MAFISPAMFATRKNSHQYGPRVHSKYYQYSRFCMSRSTNIQISCCIPRKPSQPAGGRGRPKRDTVESDAIRDFAQNEKSALTETDNEDDKAEPAARRRGRPRGSKNRRNTGSNTSLYKGQSKLEDDLAETVDKGAESLIADKERNPGRPNGTKNKSPVSRTLDIPLSDSSRKSVGPRNGAKSRRKPNAEAKGNVSEKTADEATLLNQTLKSALIERTKRNRLEATGRDDILPKRRRGRPVGSRNKSKASEVPFSDISDLEWLSFIAGGESEIDLDFLADLITEWRMRRSRSRPKKKWRNTGLKAPNGLPNSGPEDYFYEMMPLFSKLEAKQNRTLSEHEIEIQKLLSSAFQRFASTHRSSGRLANLKPYKLREDDKKTCGDCKGTGMVTCEYCAGEGFVDFGENAHKFYEEFEEGTMLLPKHVMGSIYHCPYCGGLTRERCVPCLGSGIIEDEEPRKRGASRTPVNNFAWDTFDIEEFIEREKGRVEIGLDGTIILRARKRKSGKKKVTGRETSETNLHEQKTKTPSQTTSLSAGSRRYIDYEPLQSNLIPNDESFDITRSQTREAKNPIGSREKVNSSNYPLFRATGRTTDFLTTTNYQVGQALRSDDEIPFSGKIIGGEGTTPNQGGLDEGPTPSIDETERDDQNKNLN